MPKPSEKPVDLRAEIHYEQFMKKSAMNGLDCLERMEAAANALEKDGAARHQIMSACLQIIIERANMARRPSAELGDFADLLSDCAYHAMEQEKQDRAAKRRKRLGLPEE